MKLWNFLRPFLRTSNRVVHLENALLPFCFIKVASDKPLSGNLLRWARVLFSPFAKFLDVHRTEYILEHRLYWKSTENLIRLMVFAFANFRKHYRGINFSSCFSTLLFSLLLHDWCELFDAFKFSSLAIAFREIQEGKKQKTKKTSKEKSKMTGWVLLVEKKNNDDPSRGGKMADEGLWGRTRQENSNRSGLFTHA